MATKKTAKKGAKASKSKTTSSTTKTTVRKVSAKSNIKKDKKELLASLKDKLPKAASENMSALLVGIIAEFVGTFILASLLLSTRLEPFFLMFGVIFIVATFNCLSGSLLNPALTIGAWATRRLSSIKALCFVLAQLLGGLLAIVVLTYFMSAAPQPDANQQAMMAQMQQSSPYELPKLKELPEKKEQFIFFAELFGAIILGLAVASVFKSKNRLTKGMVYGTGYFGALSIGTYATLAAQGQGAGQIVIINPAFATTLRAFDFAKLETIVIYFAAPVFGAAIGFGLYTFLQRVKTDAEAGAK